MPPSSAPSREAAPIFLDRAVDPFGGAHPSTVLAERLLRRALATRRGARLLDVGCGDGVLARAAREAGAGLVLALDRVPERAGLAARSCRAERLGGVLCADAHTMPFSTGRFDVVVANLFGATLVSAAAALAGLLGPGGALVASGALLCDEPRVCDTFVACGLTPLGAPASAAGWAARAYALPA